MAAHFDFKWVEVPDWPDIRARYSMAMLRIEVNGSVVTTATNQSDGDLRDSIVVPLFSIAEWLVCNWWHIFFEVDKGDRSHDFSSRHDLAFAGDDFVFPSVALKPVSDSIQVSWYDSRSGYPNSDHDRIEYVRREDLEEQARKIIEEVLNRLRAHDVDVEHLEREWAALNELDPEEQEFCRAAALLGEDPFDIEDSLADDITAFWAATEPSLRDEALAAADASGLTRIRMWLGNNLKKLGDTDGGDWPKLRGKLPQTDRAVMWERGYEIARAVRCELGTPNGPFNFDSDGPLAIRTGTVQNPPTRVQGLVAAESPACIVVRRGKLGERFLVARSLGDFMGRSEFGAGLLSSIYTGRQRLSRAFAAEFLAPSEDLRCRLRGTRMVGEETVDGLGKEFGVSSWLISRQIENHRLATVAPG